MSDDKKKKDKNNKELEYTPQTGNLQQRLSRVKPTRWARFGIVAAIYVAWTVWMQNPWLLLGLVLLADIYLTQFIPWGWWKGLKNKTARTLMSWVDAIVYALVLVYFLFAFVGQNYQIPSSSLEKTLLTGDFLWVNKLVYGPRVPQTPLHFPLSQNTLPLLNCKSYIEHPQLAYHRLRGVRSVERMDIVVFNFPAGDTVALKVTNPDYYTLCQQNGRDVVWNNKEMFGEVIYRPVDRRDNYVKRCLGLPGETIKIVNGLVYINGKPLPQPKNVQYNYYVQTDGSLIDNDVFDELGISVDDRHAVLGGYVLPLTDDMLADLKKRRWVTQIDRLQDDPAEADIIFPVGHNRGWTHNNMGEVWIPKRGASVRLTLENLPLYERCIRAYEGNKLEVRGGTIYINDSPATSYTFRMDYYWMMGDNRDNSLDSRFWGFVPEDHIVGTPMVVLVSFDKDKSLFGGMIRGKRIFRDANPDK